MQNKIMACMLEDVEDSIELDVMVQWDGKDVSDLIGITGGLIEGCLFSIEYAVDLKLALISFDVREQELNGYTKPDPLVVCNLFTKFGLICNKLGVEDWCCGRSIGVEYKDTKE